MNKALVSILVPIYGVEQYISKCAHSVFGQTYENIEFIFVDDSSPDNSISVLESVIADYPERYNQIQIVHHERNRGLAAARNTAVSLARGEYLTHVDSDDFLTTPVAIEKLVNIALLEDADIVVFDRLSVCSDSYVHVSHKPSDDIRHYFYSAIMWESNTIPIWGNLIRTDLYHKNKISAKEGVDFGEDYSVKPYLIYAANKIVYLPEAYYGYLKNNQSSYTQVFNIKHVKNMQIILSDFEKFFSDNNELPEFSSSIQTASLKLRIWSLKKWMRSSMNSSDFRIILNFKKSKYLGRVCFKDRILYYASLVRNPYIFKFIKLFKSKI